MALMFAVMSTLGKRRSRQLEEREIAELDAVAAERAREVTEVRFATDRILVVSGDEGDGQIWWLFRGDDGRWLCFGHEQWDDLEPSERAWNRDVRLGLDGHKSVVSIATEGPAVAVERRDLQPPDYVPTPDTLFWSPPEEKDPGSFVLPNDPMPMPMLKA
jgi:hypothetical protein